MRLCPKGQVKRPPPRPSKKATSKVAFSSAVRFSCDDFMRIISLKAQVISHQLRCLGSTSRRRDSRTCSSQKAAGTDVAPAMFGEERKINENSNFEVKTKQNAFKLRRFRIPHKNHPLKVVPSLKGPVQKQYHPENFTPFRPGGSAFLDLPNVQE